MVVDKVIHLPERFGVLLKGAAARDGRGSRPGMKLFDRKVLEDDADLARIVGQQAPQDVMKAPADRALEVRVLDQRDRGLRVSQGGRIAELDQSTRLS